MGVKGGHIYTSFYYFVKETGKMQHVYMNAFDY